MHYLSVLYLLINDIVSITLAIRMTTVLGTYRVAWRYSTKETDLVPDYAIQRISFFLILVTASENFRKYITCIVLINDKEFTDSRRLFRIQERRYAYN